MIVVALGPEPDVIMALLDVEAFCDIKDKSGLIALDCAKENPAWKDSLVYWRLNDLSF
jgi:hypothetical protein